MRRLAKFAALLVFLAVLVILLTPADDGPVMSVSGNQASSIMLLAVLAVVTRLASGQLTLVALAGVVRLPQTLGQHHSESIVSPLLC